MNRRRLIAATVGGLILIAASTADHRPHFVWNASASAPIGLYAAVAAGAPSVGQQLLYAPPRSHAELFAARRYVPIGVPLLKTVAAVAPSEVCRRGPTVSVDGVIVADAQTKDRRGRALPMWSGCRRLGSDEVFLLSPEHADALDGRYFGPVSRRRILAEVRPLWIPEQSR
ncbi:conjugative transfer signal peptidase TraF [Brevundimonas sp. 1080]|uniref:S26 family signal peptidase n=1 Tax=Brevundimonas sp. 1080 TaxID=3156405 RepID=UPI00339560DC